MQHIYKKITEKKATGKKSFAILIDPDKITMGKLISTIEIAEKADVDFIFIGGSLVVTSKLDEIVQHIKKETSIPLVIFPGNPSQVSRFADGLLYLSLISGRNPELLIGQHVVSVPMIRESGLEVISTGYMLIDGGEPTSISYMSNTIPIPSNKNEIAVCTALAGEMLGMKTIYMDAGSGAKTPITESMIHAVASQLKIPLIIGGGIREPEKAYLNCKAGADMIVVGNAIEKNEGLIIEMASAIKSCSNVKKIIE
jgi:putative glycerol-1-phosphate prenyltransferase